MNETDTSIEVLDRISFATIKLLIGIHDLHRARREFTACKSLCKGESVPSTLSIGYREVLDWFHIETGMEFSDFVEMLPPKEDVERILADRMVTGHFDFRSDGQRV